MQSWRAGPFPRSGEDRGPAGGQVDIPKRSWRAALRFALPNRPFGGALHLGAADRVPARIVAHWTKIGMRDHWAIRSGVPFLTKSGH